VRRKKRLLKPDEIALWDKVRETAVPLRPERVISAGVERAVMGETEIRADVQGVDAKNLMPESFAPFEIGSGAARKQPGHNLSPAIGARLKGQALAMDHKKHGKMTRGKLAPEARIDLHGMTLNEAHPALTGFILSAWTRGLRLVLVITGKGKQRDEGGPIPVRFGVLKNQVPNWLHMAPLKPLVLQIDEAHLKHGGTGAYYVYLRRNR
jgi:DNA-nicking Smr family endonuclease